VSTSAVINGKEIFDLLREDLSAIEREFGRDTVSGVEAITEIGEYLRGGGGKRIRPMLLLLSARLFNYQGRGAIKLGAVVEIIHTATLVHDDIIDEAQTRRGRPAAVVEVTDHAADHRTGLKRVGRREVTGDRY